MAAAEVQDSSLGPVTEQDCCEDCGGSLVEDECNGESILVCELCGSSRPVDSFTADDGTRDSIIYNSSLSRIPIESKHTAEQKKRYGAKLNSYDAKMIKLKAHIIELAGQLKLSTNQIKTVEIHAQAVVQQRIFTSSYSNKAVAAGLIYKHCFEPTQHNLKKLQALLPSHITTKILNGVVKRLASTQEQIPDAPPTPSLVNRMAIVQRRSLSCEELIRDAVSMIDYAVITREEREDVVTMATKLWDLLKYSSINCRIIVSHQSTVFAVIAVVLTHLRRVKLKESDIVTLASHVHLAKHSFLNQIRDVKKAMLSLAEMVPSLDSVVKNCGKNLFTVIRHIPILLENKSFIVAQTKLRSSFDQSSYSLPTDGSAVLMSTCVPRSYEQDDDDEDTLSDVDVDQYIASEKEVQLKQLLHS